MQSLSTYQASYFVELVGMWILLLRTDIYVFRGFVIIQILSKNKSNLFFFSGFCSPCLKIVAKVERRKNTRPQITSSKVDILKYFDGNKNVVSFPMSFFFLKLSRQRNEMFYGFIKCSKVTAIILAILWPGKQKPLCIRVWVAAV